jgi:CheY-like chemotaxis protein
MSTGSTTPLSEAEDMAEGSPKSQEVSEPDTRLKTTTMPALRLDDATLVTPEENAIVDVEVVQAEGRDNDDVQDAALFSGEPGTATEVKAVTNKTKSTPSVLIVEDTVELAEIIQATLNAMNLDTYHETHGTRGLARYLELDPDIVLLDIGLPDMIGWKIMDAIKERHEQTNGQMPIVIVITAYDDPANRLVGKLQGIHSYLVKPFTSDEIERVVREALSSTA